MGILILKNKKIIAFVLALCLLSSCGKVPSASQANSVKQDFTSAPPTNSSSEEPIVNGDGYKAIWFSYLEWQNLDMTSALSCTQGITAALDNCKKMGLNRIIVQVRPFGDAMYKSKIFPQSHLITGTQGQEAEYDPFEIFIEQAHARGIAIEGWINPYRIKLTAELPQTLSSTNPAVLYPEIVKEAAGGMYYSPSSEKARELIISGVEELVQNYNIDGVQYDDYFYPVTDAEFDAIEYAQQGNGKELSEWRRDNVNTLVKDTYAAIKAIKPNVVFGISPQGNNENNYTQQYSDVKLWLETKGYVDYIMPQIYWGYGYLTKSGRTDYQFEKLCRDFASYPRSGSVKLYIGLGAYRVGAGDGGAQEQTEWQSGHNLADMVNTLNTINSISGYSLYRYDNLFNNADYQKLASEEVNALSAINIA